MMSSSRFRRRNFASGGPRLRRLGARRSGDAAVSISCQRHDCSCRPQLHPSVSVAVSPRPVGACDGRLARWRSRCRIVHLLVLTFIAQIPPAWCTPCNRRCARERCDASASRSALQGWIKLWPQGGRLTSQNEVHPLPVRRVQASRGALMA